MWGTDCGPTCECGGSIWLYSFDDFVITAVCVLCHARGTFELLALAVPDTAAGIRKQHEGAVAKGRVRKLDTVQWEERR